RSRLPLPEALRDELCPLLLTPALQHSEVGRVGSKVDAGGSSIQLWFALRACRPVPRRAVRAFHRDLAGAFELRGIRVPRALALPEVEDAGRIPSLFRSLAPVAGRERAVGLPGSPVHGQAALAVRGDAE